MVKSHAVNGVMARGATKVSPLRRKWWRFGPCPVSCIWSSGSFRERPEFIECDKITGDDPFLARLVIHSIEQMDDVLDALSEHAVTSMAVTKRLPSNGASRHQSGFPGLARRDNGERGGHQGPEITVDKRIQD